jgi:hypothetical protein
MLSTVLTFHKALGSSHRFPAVLRIGPCVSPLEFAALLLLGGATAVVSVWAKWSLGIPGHNILRVIFPMTLGLALVPRHGAASVMGISGTATALIFAAGGQRGLGAGAITSLALMGILLDLSLWRAQSGKSVYLRLILAGLAANLAAFLVRGGAKMLPGGGVDGLPLELWWSKAIISYSICGLLAGLISAAVWFRVAARPDSGGR